MSTAGRGLAGHHVLCDITWDREGGMIVTIAERRAREIERLRAAAARAYADLGAYAARHAGRFVVFGSFARGTIAPTSDLDLLVCFPPEAALAARDHAEGVCRKHGLKPDVILDVEASPALMERVSRDGVSLP